MPARLFVTQLQPAVLAEPGQRSVHHIAAFAEPAPVGQTGPSQLRSDPPSAARRDVSRRTVGPIPLKNAGPMTGTSAGSWNGGNRIKHGDRGHAIVYVGRRGSNHQGNPFGIGDQVPFAAFFRTIGRVRPGVGPPKTARTEALSTTVRDNLMRPLRPMMFSNLAWISGQRPATVQSRSRRQQVTPLPHPISAGTIRQGSPVRKTNTMPVRQARSGTRGRPPSGLGRSTGRKGRISFHNVSVTSVNAMASPPCLAWHSIHRSIRRF